jgi:hypothetical protein
MEHARARPATEATVQREEQPFRRDFREQGNELIQRDRRGRQIVWIGVVRDEVVVVGPVPGKCDHDHIVFRDAMQALLEFVDYRRSRRGAVRQEHRRARAERIDEQRVQRRRVASRTSEFVDLRRREPIDADEEAVELHGPSYRAR